MGKKTEGTSKNQKIIGLATVVVFAVGVISFFYFTRSVDNQIPDYVKGEMRETYAWAKTEEGKSVLLSVPCYCGCTYEGHMHSYHCFWRDDGSFDKHGTTCSVCFNIAQMSKKMHEEGKTICEIRQTVDDFYKPNAHLGTQTPMPTQCA